ncbi:MAG: creatininase family protein [Myxococcota bacterium]
MKLAALTHPAAKARIDAGCVALLPVGATEAHGPHLPLDTDVRIAEEMCRRALATLGERLGLEGVVLPSIAYSVTEYAGPFTGTIGVPAEAAKAYLTAVLIGAAAQGFRAVCLVNAHLEPAHRFVLRDAASAAREVAACPVVIADPCDRRWVSRLTPEFQSGKCHAGQYETSLLLAADAPIERSAMAELPEVDIDLVGAMKAGLKTFPEMGAASAYFGRPADATAEEGHRSYAILAEIVSLVLQEALPSSTEAS